MNVLSFGEILWDIIEGENHLGGAPFNFAAHVVKCGGKASILSAVGNDSLGQLALNEAKTLGVDTSLVVVLPGIQTATVDVFLNNGQPDYTIHEGVAFDFIQRPPLEKIKDTPVDVFYLGTLAQRGITSRESLHWLLDTIKFKHVFFDINLRKNFYTHEVIEYSLKHCTVFKINDSEAKLVAKLFYATPLTLEDFAKRIAHDYAIELVIITAAEKGCYILKENKFTHTPGQPVEVVDAVGAGDSFSAAFMYAYSKHADEKKASLIANKVGAFVAGKRGAIPPYPGEIMTILK